MTPFPELNTVLANFVTSIEAILGSDLFGVYLVGSFALGDADQHSDCDFIVATRQRITTTQESAIRKLHDDIPTRTGYWNQNLEGSYAPVEDLKILDALGTPWLFGDRGWRELQWSPHCNCLEQRWTLRERGISLFGPSPVSFAAPVPASWLRSSMSEQLPQFMDDLSTWIDIEQSAWGQRYAVESLCRMFWTYTDGQVHSKPASLNWVMETFSSQWTPLLKQVQEDHALGWSSHADVPRVGSASMTRAFATEVLNRVEKLSREL
jgi:predicted nucleotidyltransferase